MNDLMKPQMNEMDPVAWTHASAARGALPVHFEHMPTINYTITPQRFVLEIPVEALANLSEDAHTRMLAMLNDWINQHKPRKGTKP